MRTRIIADLSSNHMGDMEVVEAMIRCLAEHGIDIVKTQSWQADKLRRDMSDYEINYKYYKSRELSDEDHITIKQMCDHYGIEMLTTCFDVDRVEFLASLGLRAVKVGSPDTGSHRMIAMLLDRFEHVIISTGVATEQELADTIHLCDNRDVVFLHCVVKYPCPLDEVNMERMLHLEQMGVRVGYSDHSMGTAAGKYAICLGAEYVEKHFTLSRYLSGRDQEMSATIEELAELVQWAELVDSMRGVAVPPVSDAELTYREKYIGKWGPNN